MSSVQSSHLNLIPQWIVILKGIQGPENEHIRFKILPLIAQLIQVPQDLDRLTGLLTLEEMVRILKIKQIFLLEEMCALLRENLQRVWSDHLDLETRRRVDHSTLGVKSQNQTTLPMMFWNQKQRNHRAEEKSSFQFAIDHHPTTRQGGQIVSIYVRYNYSKGPGGTQSFDYKLARAEVLKYMEPSDEFPVDTYWEKISEHIAKQLKARFSLDSVSVQLYVLDNTKTADPRDEAHYEPGDHGSTFTIGSIEPVCVWHG